MNIVSLIIEAISGAVGGNVAGAAMKDNSLGTMGNSIAGIVGGGLGGTLLQTVMGNCRGRRRFAGSDHDTEQCRPWRRWRRHPHGHRGHHQEQDGGEVATLTIPTLIPN